MAVKLSPPWFIFANEVKYTYGVSPYVNVQDLVQVGDNYELRIDVCNNHIAEALRQVLPQSMDFGGVIVTVIVYNKFGQVVPVPNIVYTPETLAKTLCTALYGNPLFVGTVLTEGKEPPDEVDVLGQVVVIIKKCVVQFYSDDISDICSNYNGVAATVFANVTSLAYPPDLKISFSTYDAKCIKPSDLYCGVNHSCGCRR